MPYFGISACKLQSCTKKEPKPKLLSPDIFRCGRGLPHEGVGPKSSACPSKPGKSNSFGGIPRDFARISRRRPKSLRKNSLCSAFWPQVKSGTKKGHKHKEFGQNPPLPDPPPKGPLTPQILQVWGLFSLRNTAKRPTYRISKGGVLGAPISLC